MKVFLNMNNLPKFKRSVLTIGSYDGVHLGHREILKKVVQKAKEIEGESILVTFHPHPRIFLQGPESGVRLLNTTQEKIQILEKTGLDHLVIVPFDEDFSSQSAEAYVRDFLAECFDPHTLIVGYDHRFGKDRSGNFEFLEEKAAVYGYELIQIEKQTLEELAVSSTKIRSALEKGDIPLVNRLLGYPYILSGKVVHGKQIGRDIGYPTANIQVEDPYKLIPPEGVYAVRGELRERKWEGMMYIGRRPTLNDNQERSIEVNIFDFDEDIYYEFLKIYLIDYVRSDKRFDSLDELKAQLSSDKQKSLEILAS
ncbi:MAG TPA: bifunctional riboflavin kinase/FAD synthetase [Saprospiraceae bacterium]|nr:bifunctional riboflavin kinase/FAD synthetase [Saprospiraceae bacterium]